MKCAVQQAQSPFRRSQNGKGNWTNDAVSFGCQLTVSKLDLTCGVRTDSDLTSPPPNICQIIFIYSTLCSLFTCIIDVACSCPNSADTFFHRISNLDSWKRHTIALQKSVCTERRIASQFASHNDKRDKRESILGSNTLHLSCRSLLTGMGDKDWRPFIYGGNMSTILRIEMRQFRVWF